MNHIEKINTIKNYKRLRDQQYDKTLEHLVVRQACVEG